MSTRRPYPSEVSDEEWAFVAPYLTLLPEDAGQCRYSLREVFNGLRYLIKSSAPWRMIPHDLPPWIIVYQQTCRWLQAGVFDALVADLRLRWRCGVIERLQTNLDLARPALERQGFQISPVNSGPYALAARRSHDGDDLDCVRLADERGTLVMSARYFFHEHSGWTGLRLNLCVPGARLSSALDRIAR